MTTRVELNIGEAKQKQCGLPVSSTSKSSLSDQSNAGKDEIEIVSKLIFWYVNQWIKSFVHKIFVPRN